MHRPNLNSLPGAERRRLAQAIQQYATPAIVNEHWEAVISGVHNNPSSFLSFHRNYIGQLENYLQAQGHTQWTPLPAWNPAEPIPPEFNVPDNGPDRLRNLNPGISFSPQFDANLGNYTTDEELGIALRPVHDTVHRTVGGVMNNLRRAPEAPIFWPWHAFIDDIWWDWQRISVIVP